MIGGGKAAAAVFSSVLRGNGSSGIIGSRGNQALGRLTATTGRITGTTGRMAATGVGLGLDAAARTRLALKAVGNQPTSLKF